MPQKQSINWKMPFPDVLLLSNPITFPYNVQAFARPIFLKFWNPQRPLRTTISNVNRLFWRKRGRGGWGRRERKKTAGEIHPQRDPRRTIDPRVEPRFHLRVSRVPVHFIRPFLSRRNYTFLASYRIFDWKLFLTSKRFSRRNIYSDIFLLTANNIQQWLILSDDNNKKRQENTKKSQPFHKLDTLLWNDSKISMMIVRHGQDNISYWKWHSIETFHVSS